ncbi:hypothetical protein [Aliamphritea ceti]|uniref:hypothetical protein n=1 Tax=Aliamphritea ceti TaxID=1524258 RepID=UPI0021C46A6B|nr:hypothetical protein [Aliamphritea ceti]
MLRYFPLIIVLVITAACAHQPQTVNQLIIQNRSAQIAYEIKLKIPESGQIVSCSSILKNSECSLGFPERALQGRLAELSWQQNGVYYSKTLQAKNISAISDQAMQAIVVILPEGELQAGLE